MSVWDSLLGIFRGKPEDNNVLQPLDIKTGQLLTKEEAAKQDKTLQNTYTPLSISTQFQGNAPQEYLDSIAQTYRYPKSEEYKHIPSAIDYYNTMYKDYGGLKGLANLRKKMQYYENPVDMIKNRNHLMNQSKQAWADLYGNKINDTLFNPTYNFIDTNIDRFPITRGSSTLKDAAGAYSPINTLVYDSDKIQKRRELYPDIEARMAINVDGSNDRQREVLSHEYHHALQDATNRQLFSSEDEYENDPFEREARLSALHTKYIMAGNKPVVTSKDTDTFYKWLQDYRKQLSANNDRHPMHLNDLDILLNPVKKKSTKSLMRSIVSNQNNKNSEQYA